MVFLFLFLMGGVLVINDTGTEFLLSVDSFLNNPNNVFVLDEHTLLVDDPGAPYPLYQIDLRTGEITNRIRNGQGPGELGQMYKTITFPDDESIAVFDREQMLLHLYDRDLQHIRTESGSFFRENPMQAGLLSSGHAFAIPSDSD
jgi:hypothetical protein